LEVVYNYNSGEEMVVRTEVLLDPFAPGGNADVMYVDAFKTNDVLGSRLTWQQWTDAVYRIERKRYASAVATVYRRMFSLPHHKVDLDVKQSVKFNDILGFKYLGDGQYPVIDCSWDVSKGRSTVRMVKSFYSDATADTGNIPPIVDAGADQVLVHPNNTVATLTSQSFDTDGFITTRQWQQLSGPTTAFIANPTGAITMVQNLVGGEYVFQVTVTDNNGSTASDTVRVRKVRYYQVTYVLQTLSFYLRRWGLVFTPAIPDNETIRVSGLYDFSQGGQASEQHFKVFKNGVLIVDKVRSGPDDVNGRFEFNYINGNNIVVQVNDARVDMQGHIFLNGIDIAQGPGQILQ
jgi:hypothetical protein